MKRSFRLIINSLIILLILTLSGSIFAQAQSAKYIVATSADYPPFEWIDGHSNCVGFDADVMRAIAIIEGYEIEIQDLGFDSLVPALQAGKVDILAAGLEMTPERVEVIDCSDSYWETMQGVLVRENSDLNIITALSQGHKVGTQKGTAQMTWIQDNLIKNEVNLKLELYETNDLGIMDLVNGRIDAYVQDTPVAEAFARSNPVKMVGSFFTFGKLVFYVQKGDSKKLLPKLNDGLKKLKGEIWDNLVDAYFTGDLEKITDSYAQCSHYLTVEKDVATYAKKLAECMTAK